MSRQCIRSCCLYSNHEARRSPVQSRAWKAALYAGLRVVYSAISLQTIIPGSARSRLAFQTANLRSGAHMRCAFLNARSI